MGSDSTFPNQNSDALVNLLTRIDQENPSVSIRKKDSNDIYFGKMSLDPLVSGVLMFTMSDAQRSWIKGDPFVDDVDYEVNLVLASGLLCFWTRAILGSPGMDSRFLAPVDPDDVFQRQGLRLPILVKHKILLTCTDTSNYQSQTQKYRVIDLSPKGARIRVPSSEQMKENSTWNNAVIGLPTGAVKLEAQVRQRDSDQAGLQFLNMSDEAKLILQAYLGQLIREHTYGED